MRTLLNIDEKLLNYAKHRALEERLSLTQLVENALRVLLAKSPKSDEKVRLVTASGAGLKHGVDLDNSASLRAILDD